MIVIFEKRKGDNSINRVIAFSILILESLSVFLFVELKEGTFLVLEDYRYYVSTTQHLQAQGKYLSRVRRVSSHAKNFSVTKRYFQPLSAQNFSADLLFTSTFRFVCSSLLYVDFDFFALLFGI